MTHFVYGGIIVVLVLVASMYAGSWQTQALNSMQDCIVAQAALEGYAGDPYSAEAWNTFSPLCR